MSFLRALWRIVFFATCTSATLARIILHSLLHGPDLDYTLHHRKKCIRRLVKMLGAQIKRSGTPSPPEKGPYLLVGNHRSYFDPIVVLADLTALPISKAEVAHWPLIGFAARQTGVLFVKREQSESRRKTLEAMREKLQQGYSILLFPEGTTSETGHKLLPLRPGSFRLAAELNIPVVPFAIEYQTPGDAWIGDDTFIPHFFRCFGKKHTHISLSYGPPMQNSDPEKLREEVRAWIDGELDSFKNLDQRVV